MGWSSANSSGAGTNILTILGADSKLDFVAPSGNWGRRNKKGKKITTHKCKLLEEQTSKEDP